MALTYSIRAGDTLRKIANHFGLTVNQILQSNPQIVDRNTIYAGQTLHLDVPNRTPSSIHAAEARGAGPLWYKIANREMETGVVELPGSQHNPRILEYHASTTLDRRYARQDETAWCSSFVNWCMIQAGNRGTNSAWSRSWLNYGVKLSEPRLGCIVVLTRNNNPSEGHVAFFKQASGSKLSLLGGNQSNRVRVSRYDRSRLLEYRWPAGGG